MHNPLFVIVIGLATLAAQASATERISVTATGQQANDWSLNASLTGDGRYVVFRSQATNLTADTVFSQANVFRRDRVTDAVIRVSIGPTGGETNGWSDFPVASADGSVIAFDSFASNFVTNDGNGFRDVFVRDLNAGTFVLASVGTNGSSGFGESRDPAISPDGNLVAFSSAAPTLIVGDSNGKKDIFVRDLAAGTTIALSLTAGGVTGNGDSSRPVFSQDGRFVAFVSRASNLVSGDTNGIDDIFVYDLLTGTLACASCTAGGQSGAGAAAPSISGDGRYVAFHDKRSLHVSGDSNGTEDIFVRDLQTGLTIRASVGDTGQQANGSSTNASISADGRYVAFNSAASNLVPADTNGVADIFVRDLVAGTTTLVSRPVGGGLSDGDSFVPRITADGQEVVYTSTAGNLVSDDTNGFFDVFLSPAAPTINPDPATLAWPVDDPIVTQGYAAFGLVVAGEYHTGIDLVSSTADPNNTPVYAAGDGVARVVPIGSYANENHNLGNAVVIRHPLAGGVSTLYAHLKSITVADGASVTAGQQIGIMGNTGTGAAPGENIHLHFELKPRDALGNLDDDLGPEWGYTPASPNLHGYRNPYPWLDLPIETIDPLVVSSPTMQDVRTGPDADDYTHIVATVDAGQEYVAFAYADGWYEIDLPSSVGPASGWIAAEAAEIGTWRTVVIPNEPLVGLNLRARPRVGAPVLSKLWHGQRFVPLGMRAVDLAACDCWHKFAIPVGATRTVAWGCGLFLNEDGETCGPKQQASEIPVP